MNYPTRAALLSATAIEAWAATVPPLKLASHEHRSTGDEVGTYERVEEVGRIVLDVTSKPPGTIEWE